MLTFGILGLKRGPAENSLYCRLSKYMRFFNCWLQIRQNCFCLLKFISIYIVLSKILQRILFIHIIKMRWYNFVIKLVVWYNKFQLNSDHFTLQIEWNKIESIQFLGALLSRRLCSIQFFSMKFTYDSNRMDEFFSINQSIALNINHCILVAHMWRHTAQPGPAIGAECPHSIPWVRTLTNNYISYNCYILFI